MAYDPRVDSGARNTFHHPFDENTQPSDNELSRLVNILGAVISIALIVGLCIWGYKLMMRDVTGIPIVRATEGEMRARPDDPGGDLALHQGLAVNVIAAEGEAEAPAQRLLLAPQPVALTEEDMPIEAEAVAIVQQAIADQTATTIEDTSSRDPIDSAVAIDQDQVVAAVDSGSVETLVAALTENIEPLDAPATQRDIGAKFVPAVATNDDITNALTVAMRDVPGLHLSLRPQVRPAGLSTAPRTVAASETAVGFVDIDPATLPKGTRLVQLGAYDSPDVARSEWGNFQGRFGDLMMGKDRVVQLASSGGRQFYRLRAAGFEDLADARRFCSVIVADGADCIPVVTR